MKLFLFLLILLLPGSIFSQEEEPKSKFSGYMFGDYFYNISRDTAISSIKYKALDGNKDLNGFLIRKIYFTFDSDISEKFSVRFRLNAEPQTQLPNGKMGVDVKDAFLKWKDIFPGSDFYFGLQPTPAFYTTVDFWGYRLLEKSPLDLRNIAPSRDIAVSLKGRLDGQGIFNYWLLIGNGKDSNSGIDKYKRIYAHLHLIPSKSWKIILYGDIKFQPEINYQSGSGNEENLNNNIYTSDLFIGYIYLDIFRIGIEGYIQHVKNGYFLTGDAGIRFRNKNTTGFSVFDVFNINALFSVIGRYDYFDNNTGIKGDSRNYFIFGFSYKPDPNVSVTPNILIETYERLPGARSYHQSVTARITFFYNYL